MASMPQTKIVDAPFVTPEENVAAMFEDLTKALAKNDYLFAAGLIYMIARSLPEQVVRDKNESVPELMEFLTTELDVALDATPQNKARISFLQQHLRDLS